MKHLFGTDGIRGAAGAAPLDRPTLIRIGYALARHLSEPNPRILIGRDTRSSGADLETWLQEGIRTGGGQTVSAGVLTTPAVAILTRRFGFSAGVMISASHNPYPDNGVKVFSSNGNKSSDQLESAIESEVLNTRFELSVVETPRPTPDPTLRREYTSFLESTLSSSPNLAGLRIVLDCANGGGYEVGPSLLSSLGLTVASIGVTPDGRNINQNCGSTHPEHMARRVVETSSDLGAALDGDGDRLILGRSRRKHHQRRCHPPHVRQKIEKRKSPSRTGGRRHRDEQSGSRKGTRIGGNTLVSNASRRQIRFRRNVSTGATSRW